MLFVTGVGVTRSSDLNFSDLNFRFTAGRSAGALKLSVHCTLWRIRISSTDLFITGSDLTVFFRMKHHRDDNLTLSIQTHEATYM